MTSITIRSTYFVLFRFSFHFFVKYIKFRVYVTLSIVWSTLCTPTYTREHMSNVRELINQATSDVDCLKLDDWNSYDKNICTNKPIYCFVRNCASRDDKLLAKLFQYFDQYIA